VACEVNESFEKEQTLTYVNFFTAMEVALAAAQCETAVACASAIIGAKLE
jgi:hypothetical protein